jgi:hypothetical protein
MGGNNRLTARTTAKVISIWVGADMYTISLVIVVDLALTLASSQTIARKRTKQPSARLREGNCNFKLAIDRLMAWTSKAFADR